MIKAGVIGHPVAHSKSPFIHGYWLTHYCIDGQYDRYDISPDSLESRVQELVKSGLRGFNVTIPHKQSVLPLCQNLSARARRVGAVNCVSISADGVLSGDNTDGFGFIQNVRETLPELSFEELSVLVIGAGGAARAIIDALQEAGSLVTIINRTQEKADFLATEFSCHSMAWQEAVSAIGAFDFIVNTTCLGMTGQPDLDVSLAGAKDSAVIADIVYVPLETAFLARARSRNLRCVSGIGMLLHQARPAFERWFGVFPDVDAALMRVVLSP